MLAPPKPMPQKKKKVILRVQPQQQKLNLKFNWGQLYKSFLIIPCYYK
uniref:Uncharacterized protein n=1 Tax=Rhizophora mucronata TaxID=61149 RepID=A0A2P2N3A1_RHIMU